jgi:sterol desaturase/sphingolipid hydroxylase (fatty acid hydroxylase superfamily)
VVGHLGIVGGLAASLLTSDLIHYSLHRLGHEWGPAWTFHSVHHSPERLHIFNATRFHPVEQAVEGVLEGFALGAVGFTTPQHLTHATARATYGQLQHANIAVDSGALDHVFATPDLHRWHHSEIYAEGDTNYGAVISVWDRLFGTFFRPDRAFDAKLGVGRMPDFPQRLWGLLATPFRWAAIKRRNADTWYGDADANPDVHQRS